MYKEKKERKKMKTQTEIIERIRTNYVEKEVTELDKLKALDKKVKRPAQVFAYVFGSLSSLVLGLGMSLAMKVIGSTLSFAMPLGIGIGLLGILLVLINYPIYKKMLKKRKAKYSSSIIELSDNLLNK